MNKVANDSLLRAYADVVSEVNPEDSCRRAYQKAHHQLGEHSSVLARTSSQSILSQQDNMSIFDPSDRPARPFTVLKSFSIARNAYLMSLPSLDLETVKAKVRAIDPRLIGEKRYGDRSCTLVKFALDFFYGFKRLLTSQETIDRLKGRIEILSDESEDESIDRSQFHTPVQSRRPSIEGYDSSSLSDIEENDIWRGDVFYTPSSSRRASMQEERSPCSVRAYVEESKEEKRKDPRVAQATAKSILMSPFMTQAELIPTLLKLFPISLIQDLEQMERENGSQMLHAKISYASPIEGQASQVNPPGMKDFAKARLVAADAIDVHVDPEKMIMKFSPGALKMGIVIEDFDFYLSRMKIGPVILGVDTGLKALRTGLEKFCSKGLQITLDINSIEVDNHGRVTLAVTPNFDEKVMMDTKASEPPALIHGQLKKVVKQVVMSPSQFEATFDHLEWNPLQR